MTRLEEATPALAAQGEATFEQRWDAWQAKTHGRTMRTRMHGRFGLAALALLVGAVALWMIGG